MQTLTLPAGAARAHLRQHPLDTEGPCPQPITEPETQDVLVDPVDPEPVPDEPGAPDIAEPEDPDTEPDPEPEVTPE